MPVPHEKPVSESRASANAGCTDSELTHHMTKATDESGSSDTAKLKAGIKAKIARIRKAA
jgi:hypothetical protein